MTITISGLPGSGKTSLVKTLATQLDRPWISIGNVREQLAKERGLSVQAYNDLATEDPSIDRDTEAFQSAKAQESPETIFEGWMSWYAVPESFKVFLTVEQEIAAQRIFAAKQKAGVRLDEPSYANLDEVKQAVERRLSGSRAQYQKLYGVDFLDPSHYDLVIDTSHKTPQEVLAEVVHGFKNHLIS